MDEAGSRIRAFVALEIPANWRRGLGELQRDLKIELPGPAYRWVKPEQMHLTLRFFGSISGRDAQAVSEALTAIAAETACMRLKAEGLGCFPNARRARVLWAGLTGELEALGRLHHAIGRATAGIGEPPDERPFTPHLTLARVKDATMADLRPLNQALNRPFALESWTVASVRLYRSELGPAGARYELLSAHDFSGTESSPLCG